MTPEVCPNCGRPRGTRDGWLNRPRDIDGADDMRWGDARCYRPWSTSQCDLAADDWRVRMLAAAERIDWLLSRERYFAEMLGVPTLGSTREAWQVAMEAHDAQVVQRANGRAEATPRPQGTLADLSPQESAMVRAIEAMAVAIGHDRPVVLVRREERVGIDYIEVVSQKIVANTPMSGRPGRRATEIQDLLHSMSMLADHVLRRRQADLDRLQQDTPAQVEALSASIAEIRRAAAQCDNERRDPCVVLRDRKEPL